MSKHQALQNKIVDLNQLAIIVKDLKYSGKSIVFTNGCFDILHKGHVDYLAKAADLGDVLIVAVNTDESVRKLGKSNTRPIQDENARLFVLAALSSVDYVLLFNQDTPLDVIKVLLPDVLVKGADYLPENIVGYNEVVNNGGRVDTIDFIEGYSTSLIEKKIKNS
ncbi:MAG: D-glycero-beta-D-manno-heptose 1-phosphate adenylyltransferase [Bacteroidota bacterium]|nr:D-glycero-beta-D-manno-heptose 1-phosphate adenylyltransferase [Bacteroidota bacterium]